MTRDELVTFVCTSTGYSEPDDVSACKTFMVARDRMIYDSALWKDSLIMSLIALNPTTNEDHAEGIVFLPESMCRAVAVRTGENLLRVQGLESYFRVDLDQFQQTGSPFEFSILNPEWFKSRGLVGLVIGYGAADSGAAIRIAWRDGNVRNISNVTLAGTPKLTTAAIGEFVVTGAGETAANGSYTWDEAGQLWINQSDPNYTIVYSLGQWSVYYSGLTGVYRAAAPEGPWTVDGGSAPAPTVVPPADCNIEVESVFKGVTSAPITFTQQMSATVDGTLAAAATHSPSYQRLRLFKAPQVATTLRILGKSSYQSLDFPQQEPFLRNSENALIAFTRGDMLRRGGENGAANLAFAEATTLLQLLKDVEAVQAANNVRIQPESGYGPDWAQWRNGFYW